MPLEHPSGVWRLHGSSEEVATSDTPTAVADLRTSKKHSNHYPLSSGVRDGADRCSWNTHLRVDKYDITVQPSTVQDGLIASHIIHCSDEYSALTGGSTLCKIVISWSKGRTDVRGAGIPQKSHFEPAWQRVSQCLRAEVATSPQVGMTLVCGLRAALHNQ
jgi:hypothetical protein